MNELYIPHATVDRYEVCIPLNVETAPIFSAALWGLNHEWLERVTILLKNGSVNINASSDVDFLIIKNGYDFYITKNSSDYIINNISYYICHGYAQTDHLHVECRCESINEYNSFDLTILFDKFKQALSPEEVACQLDELS